MKPIFKIEPLKGAGNIQFGMNREQVRVALGKPAEIEETSDFFHGSDLRIDYDLNDFVEYIEFNGPCPEQIQVLIADKDIFAMKVNAFLDFIETQFNIKVIRTEDADSYAFQDLEMFIWTDYMVDEKNNFHEEQHIWSIGIGKKGYLADNGLID